MHPTAGHMTTTTAPRPSTRTTGASAGQWAIALLLPIGPAAVAVLRFILPYYTADSHAGVVASVADHPGRQSAVLWLGYIAVLTLVPGVFAVARVCRTAAPRLTAWAVALSVPGYLSMGVFLATDQVLWSASDAGLSPHDSASLLAAAHPTVDISIGVFVVGHVIGTVILGLALVRSGQVPAWAGWVIAVSQPLHFVATVILGSPQVDLVAWSMTAVGMAVVGRTLVRGDWRHATEAA